MERRHFLKFAGITGVAGLVAGCQDPAGIIVPDAIGDDGICIDELKRLSTRPRITPARSKKVAAVKPAKQVVGMVPRSAWNAGRPISARLNPMKRVRRITVHHEGCPRANWHSSATSVAQDLRRIQVEHRKRMRAGDIGYHYVIDRQGRIWEGRSLSYQGAHVRGNNDGNVGIMCLGNFDLQQPSQKQLLALQGLVQTVSAHYRIVPKTVFGHSELVATRCPGKNLKPHLHSMRGVLARA